MRTYKPVKNMLLNIPLSDLIIWDKHIKKNYDMNLKMMTASLKSYGQTTPLTVRKKIIKGEEKYEIIDGIERYLSAKKLEKIKKMSCFVRNISDRQALLLQALNNSGDNKVSGYERAQAYKAALYEESIQQKDLAEQLEIAKSTLTRRMSFLKIDKEFWESVDDTAIITDTLANEMVVIINKNHKTKKFKHKQLINKLIKICKTKPILSNLNILAKEVENKQIIEKSFVHNKNIIFSFRDNKIVFSNKYIDKIDISGLLDIIEVHVSKQILEN